MQKRTFRFSNSSVDFYFEGSFLGLKNIVDPQHSIIITDENLYSLHQKKFSKWKTIVIKAGEENKVQSTVDSIIIQLLEHGADRKTTLIGVGGGVITDITGYVASVYLRGISFGFIPTTILAIVDASIGGKNGIDIGIYKNIVGVIRQPLFIIHDTSLLATLPHNEWVNGFAEIIKHASIKDISLFKELEKNSIVFYQKKKKDLAALIKRNALIKIRVVQQDEFEQGDRKLLNFGHTLGHAIENQYRLSHGEAIAIGMAFACSLSQKITGFKDCVRLEALLSKYELPTTLTYEKEKVMKVLIKDKKKVRNNISFILLNKIGKAVITELTVNQLKMELI